MCIISIKMPLLYTRLELDGPHWRLHLSKTFAPNLLTFVTLNDE